jgi:hypothetical protein
MSKTPVLVALLLVGVAMADMVCLPNQYQWQRSQEFVPEANNGYGMFDLAEEWYDFSAKNFRWRQKTWVNNVEVLNDMLIIGSQQKLYTVNGTSGSGSVTCTVQKAVFPNSSPCLMANATISGQYFVAGDVFVQVWAESGIFNNVTIYSEVSLTADSNIPVYSREFITNVGISAEMYYNYNLNLDADAFQIPTICPTTTELPGVYPEAELRRRFKWLRH